MFQFDTKDIECKCDAKLFPLVSPTIELFDKTANALAKEISAPQILEEKEEWDNNARRKIKIWKVITNRNLNKPSQIRKFYDELEMWVDKSQTEETLRANLPFIKMLNAKVAYARGREHVDDKFISWMSVCLAQINSATKEDIEKLNNFKTLFEAFLGFYKVARPK